MKELLNLINLFLQKKWAAAGFLLLFTGLMITGPAWAITKVGAAVTEQIAPIHDAIEAMQCDVEAFGEIQFKQVFGSAISAYDKFDTLEDIANSSSSQNKQAIQLALSIPDVRAMLFIANPQKTLIFEDYFNNQRG